MTGDESYDEECRCKIFDAIFRGGPAVYGVLETRTRVPRGHIVALTDHEWFTKQAGVVGIARESGPFPESH